MAWSLVGMPPAELGFVLSLNEVHDDARITTAYFQISDANGRAVTSGTAVDLLMETEYQDDVNFTCQTGYDGRCNIPITLNWQNC